MARTDSSGTLLLLRERKADRIRVHEIGCVLDIRRYDDSRILIKVPNRLLLFPALVH